MPPARTPVQAYTYRIRIEECFDEDYIATQSTVGDEHQPAKCGAESFVEHRSTPRLLRETELLCF
jgi:hypothetical protein